MCQKNGVLGEFLQERRQLPRIGSALFGIGQVFAGGEAGCDCVAGIADHLIEEVVWVEISHREPIDPAKIGPSDSGTIQTNVVELYRMDEPRICAVVAPEDPSVGVFGIGESVHDALRHLADELVRTGV